MVLTVMDFNTYQELSKRTMPPYGNYAEHRDTLGNYALGLAGESGETVDLIKKKLHHGHEVSLEEIKNELGDVLHYLSGIATIFDISLQDVAEANLAKLSKRYPNGFNTADSIARVDVVEDKA